MHKQFTHFVSLIRLLFCLCLVSALLSGCAFHLRGEKQFSPDIYSLAISSKAPNDSLVLALKEALAANGVTVVKDPSLAKTRLVLSNYEMSSNLISNGGIAISGAYTVSAHVTFSVVNQAGKVLLQPMTLSRVENFTSNATQVLSAANTVSQLSKTLEQSLANQIVRAPATLHGS